jgi:hypothetical protein
LAEVVTDIAPIARMLFGDDDGTPDGVITCCICGEKTKLAGFLVRTLKFWNNSKDYIKTTSDMITPAALTIACEGECNAKLYAMKHEEVQREHAQTIALLAMLFAGKYNPESIAWLRSHGCRRQVEYVLAKEGTSKANAA